MEVNHNARHQLPLVGRVANDLVLPHWSQFSWGLTAIEITAGALLVAGLASRLGALLALGPGVFLFFVYFGNDRCCSSSPWSWSRSCCWLWSPPGGGGASTARGWPF